jgi:hypothetical protein
VVGEVAGSRGARPSNPRLGYEDAPMRAWILPLAALAGFVPGCSATHTEAPAIAALSSVPTATAIGLEGTARGFPAMRDLHGEPLAQGEFSQWTEGDRVHVFVRYVFGPDRWIEERSVLQQQPTLVHEHWSWVEIRGGEVHRKFEVDFRTGNATAEKRHGTEMRRWSEHLDLEPGRAFAGGAWPLAIRWNRDRLLRGEKLRFQAVGFTPKPKSAEVEITREGVYQLTMADRAPIGDRYRIHPDLPWIAKPFVDVPDSLIWLAHEPPAAFLRWEGALMEPDDEIIRVDLLPGGASGPAVPVRD